MRLASIIGAFIVGFWLPIHVIGLTPKMRYEVFFNLIVAVVSALNIYVHFKNPHHDPRERRSWMSLGLWADIVCLIPVPSLVYMITGQFYPWLPFINLLCVRHVSQIKSFLDEFDSLQPIVYRLVPLVISMPLLVHIIACIWIALGSGTIGPDPDMTLTYVRAVYWTFTTLTTVGYGDISAKTIPQMLMASGVQVIGVGVFGFILSNVASILSRSDAAREHHMDNLDKIDTFIKIHQIPNELESKIRAYYYYLWKNKKGYQDNSLLESLPGKLQSEMLMWINKAIVEKVPFLKGAQPEMIEDLMDRLEPRIYVPGERVFRVDDPGDALYLVHKGKVDILTRENKTIATLPEGAFFGEMALVNHKPRSATARAGSFCELYLLRKESFDQVLQTYPDFRNHIEKVVRERNAA